MKASLIFITCILSSMIVKAQNEQILAIQSTGANSQYANVNSQSPNTSDGSSSEVDAFVWGGVPSIAHFYLQFNLSGLPANAIIDSAYLYLYANLSALNGTPGSPTSGSNNAVGIYQVTSSWSPTTISWNAQPGFTSTNFVTLPQSSSATEDYAAIDVTHVLNNIVGSGNNYGFLVKLLQETTASNSMIFYSPNASAKQPNLFICYHLP